MMFRENCRRNEFTFEPSNLVFSINDTMKYLYIIFGAVFRSKIPRAKFKIVKTPFFIEVMTNILRKQFHRQNRTFQKFIIL